MGKLKENIFVKKVGLNRIILVGVLLLMYLAFGALTGGKFFTVSRLMNIFNYVYFLGFLALGVTFVIATGGSAVYGKEAMAKLKENGITVYLRLSPDELEKRINNIHTRGIAMKDGTTLAELYNERAPLYEKYADITVNCSSLTPEQCVESITEKIKGIQ